MAPSPPPQPVENQPSPKGSPRTTRSGRSMMFSLPIRGLSASTVATRLHTPQPSPALPPQPTLTNASPIFSIDRHTLPYRRPAARQYSATPQSHNPSPSNARIAPSVAQDETSTGDSTTAFNQPPSSGKKTSSSGAKTSTSDAKKAKVNNSIVSLAIFVHVTDVLTMSDRNRRFSCTALFGIGRNLPWKPC